MHKVFARAAYWRERPPVHVLVAHIAHGLGAWEPPKGKAKRLTSEETQAKLREMAPGGLL